MERGLTEGGTIWTLPARSAVWAACVAAVSAALVYANAPANGFAYDDRPIIVENPSIHSLSNLPTTLAEPYWTGNRGREAGIWRPVTTAVMTVEWALWGEEPGPYHGANVVLHAAVTGVGTLVMAQLVPVPAALLGGLVFAVHPVHVEAVANLVGLSELLTALFLLGACLVHLRAGRRSHYGSGSVAAVSLLYALAFLSKENGAVLPALLLLVDAWKDRLELRDLPGYLKERGVLYGSLAAVAILVLIARFQVLGGIGSPGAPLGAHLLHEVPVIWTLPLVWLHYVRLLVFPADLSPDYSPAVIDVQLGWNLQNGVGLLLVVAALALAWASWKRRGPETTLALAAGWFVIAILPVANLLFLTEILLAERTLYLPSFGVALAAGALLWHGATAVPGRHRRAVVAVAGLVGLVAMVGRTWTATPVWESTPSVMNHILERHPESGRAQWMLADVLTRQTPGSPEGLAYFSRAVSTTDASYPVVMSLADHLIAMDALEPAATLLRYQWEWWPERGRAPSRLAVVLSRMGRYGEAVEPATAALAVEPGNAVLLHLLSVAHGQEGDLDQALRYRQAAIEEGEGARWEQWRWLADLQRDVGDRAGALASLDSARVRATDPSVRAILDSLRADWTP